MRNKIITAALAAGLTLASAAADAGYGRHGHYYRGHYHHGHHGGHGALVAAGVLGGALLLGTLLSTPYYYSAPPTPVYYNPPPREPYCVRDRVYRHLPDGSVQWGVRTRCY